MTSTDMKLTVSARRSALVVLAVLCLAVVYLVGVTRSGAPASAGTVNTSSAPASTVIGGGATGITVGGKADVAGTPDTLRLDLSVVVAAPSVSGALAKANGTAAAVQKSLLDNGVAKKDLQTSGLTITPRYDDKAPAAPRITGYEVSESVSAKLRDLGRAGDSIGKAVGAGGNAVRVNAISLDLEDTGALVSKARDEAFADATTKAGQYAKAAGRSLGDVVSITESVEAPSPVPMPAGSFGMAAKSPVPIQPGSQNVSVAVTVVFAMS